MLRLLAITGSLLAGIASAEACSIPYFEGDPGPPPTPEQVADSLPEVVIEGVVIYREPITGEPGATDSHFRQARMRVDRVWKGEAAEIVILEFGEPGSMCEAIPPVGEPLRVSLDPISPNVFGYDMLSGFGPRGPNEDAGLQLYQERTLALQRQAETGGPAEKRAFAAYLRSNGETHRALWMYEALLRRMPNDLEVMQALAVLQRATHQDAEALATLRRLSALAPKTEEWRGKLARVTFEVTGQLSLSWKDWSYVENVGTCRQSLANFDHANFAVARLDCRFADTTFRGADFRGADITRTKFENSVDLTGARYDCATQLPYGLDPIAAGMIKTDVQCSAP